MTKAIEDELGLPPLNELKKAMEKAEQNKQTEEEINELENIEDEQVKNSIQNALKQSSLIKDKLESDLEAMDDELNEIAEDAIEMYHDLFDLGMNSPTAHSGKIFEAATSMVKNAIDARTAKADRKLKLMKLKLEQARFERMLEKDKEKDDEGVIDSDETIAMDRNRLLSELAKKLKDSSDED